MAKSYLRESKASGSTWARVNKLIALGWYPGARVKDILRRKEWRGYTSKARGEM